MECSIFKLTLNDSPTFSNAEDFESYMLNNYTRETELIIEDSSNQGVAFFYLKENTLYSVLFAKENFNISGSNHMQITDNGNCYPSAIYKVEIGKHANLDVQDYTGSTDDLNTLFTRIAAFCECNQGDDEKTTLEELDNWISTNSKSYTIDNVLEKSGGQYEYTEHWGFLDSSSQFSSEIGTWFTTHIDANLSETYTQSEFIEKYSS